MKIFKWFIPVVCDYNIKYQNDIRLVSQNLGPDPHKSLQDLTELNTLSGIEGYTMDTQPSVPGPQ